MIQCWVFSSSGVYLIDLDKYSIIQLSQVDESKTTSQYLWLFKSKDKAWCTFVLAEPTFSLHYPPRISHMQTNLPFILVVRPALGVTLYSYVYPPLHGFFLNGSKAPGGSVGAGSGFDR